MHAKFNNKFVGGSALLLKLKISGMLMNEQCHVSCKACKHYCMYLQYLWSSSYTALTGTIILWIWCHQHFTSDNSPLPPSGAI